MKTKNILQDHGIFNNKREKKLLGYNFYTACDGDEMRFKNVFVRALSADKILFFNDNLNQYGILDVIDYEGVPVLLPRNHFLQNIPSHDLAENSFYYKGVLYIVFLTQVIKFNLEMDIIETINFGSTITGNIIFAVDSNNIFIYDKEKKVLKEWDDKTKTLIEHKEISKHLSNSSCPINHKTTFVMEDNIYLPSIVDGDIVINCINYKTNTDNLYSIPTIETTTNVEILKIKDVILVVSNGKDASEKEKTTIYHIDYKKWYTICHSESINGHHTMERDVLKRNNAIIFQDKANDFIKYYIDSVIFNRNFAFLQDIGTFSEKIIIDSDSTLSVTEDGLVVIDSYSNQAMIYNFVFN